MYNPDSESVSFDLQQMEMNVMMQIRRYAYVLALCLFAASASVLADDFEYRLKAENVVGVG